MPPFQRLRQLDRPCKAQESACHRAAKFEPKPSLASKLVYEATNASLGVEKRGAFEGPTRISSHSLLYVFNIFTFPHRFFKVLEIPFGMVFDPHRAYQNHSNDVAYYNVSTTYTLTFSL